MVTMYWICDDCDSTYYWHPEPCEFCGGYNLHEVEGDDD